MWKWNLLYLKCIKWRLVNQFLFCQSPHSCSLATVGQVTSAKNDQDTSTCLASSSILNHKVDTQQAFSEIYKEVPIGDKSIQQRILATAVAVVIGIVQPPLSAQKRFHWSSDSRNRTHARTRTIENQCKIDIQRESTWSITNTSHHMTRVLCVSVWPVIHLAVFPISLSQFHASVHARNDWQN